MADRYAAKVAVRSKRTGKVLGHFGNGRVDKHNGEDSVELRSTIHQSARYMFKIVVSGAVPTIEMDETTNLDHPEAYEGFTPVTAV